MSSLGFLGLGNMGLEMANNLSKYAKDNNLPPISVWNRTAEKCSKVEGAKPCSTPEDVVSKSDMIFTCFIDDKAAEEVYDKMFTKKGVIFVDHSTILPGTAASLESRARESGSTFLSCPVFGRPDAARAAKLLVVMAGEAEAKAKVKEILVPGIGRGAIDAGVEASKGVTLKLLGNSTILGAIELLSETFALSDKIGFDSKVLYEFIQQFYPVPAFLGYGGKIASADFDGSSGFKIDGGLKDANHILSLDETYKMPSIVAAKDHMERAKAIGGKDLDWSALAVASREDAGLKPFKDGPSA